MNERIKELYNKVVGDDRLNFDSYLAEKFAELIIQECAKFADDKAPRDPWAVGVKMIHHFGVE